MQDVCQKFGFVDVAGCGQQFSKCIRLVIKADVRAVFALGGCHSATLRNRKPDDCRTHLHRGTAVREIAISLQVASLSGMVVWWHLSGFAFSTFGCFPKNAPSNVGTEFFAPDQSIRRSLNRWAMLCRNSVNPPLVNYRVSRQSERSRKRRNTASALDGPVYWRVN